MRTLNCSLQEAAHDFADQTRAFLDVANAMSDLELLDTSLCLGWSRLDAIVHVRTGLEEMAASVGIPSSAPVDADAVSYWMGSQDDDDKDPVPHILWLRRTASAYQRPSSAVRHLNIVAQHAIDAVSNMPDRAVRFQGMNLMAGDFVTTWVVELAIHQLDLDQGGTPPPGCKVARQTIEALAETDLPQSLDDRQAVLAGLGRIPWPTSERPRGFPIAL